MTRRRKPYDPIAYQAELDAKCGKAGAAFLGKKQGMSQAIHGTEGDDLLAKRLELRLLSDPELRHEIPEEVLRHMGLD